MIDWCKCRIPFCHSPISGGAVVFVEPCGSVSREVPRPLSVRGSYEASIQVSSWGSDGQGNATHLVINGNPSKFLQGHNVVGSDDLSMLVRLTFDRVCQSLGLVPGLYRDSDVSLRWVDINYMYQLGSLTDVRAWLSAAEFSARTRSGRAVAKGSTVYLQKNSRRWAIKFYSKYDEFAAHPLPDDLLSSGLVEFSENLLRVELRLLRKELETIGIETVADLPVGRVQKIFGDYMKRVVLTDRVRLPEKTIFELPAHVRGTYALWHDGHDVKSILSRPTFYRHRSELLRYGIDISLSAPIDRPNNVIPLLRTLEASQIQIPAWIYERKLVAGWE